MEIRSYSYTRLLFRYLFLASLICNLTRYFTLPCNRCLVAESLSCALCVHFVQSRLKHSGGKTSINRRVWSECEGGGWGPHPSLPVKTLYPIPRFRQKEFEYAMRKGTARARKRGELDSF
jgi:hypothetical protein